MYVEKKYDHTGAGFFYRTLMPTYLTSFPTRFIPCPLEKKTTANTHDDGALHH
jgi:hypothetical protein